MKDSEYMELALMLAKNGLGWTAPNPMVGAVLVKDGEIIGQGWHEKCGEPHAERNALANCKKSPQGATLYVTLEPCPMCCGAILHARLDHLVFGAYDPKGGAVASVESMFDLPYNYHPTIEGGFLQENCATVLTQFFRELRRKKKEQAK